MCAALLSGASCQVSVIYRCYKSCQLLVAKCFPRLFSFRSFIEFHTLLFVFLYTHRFDQFPLYLAPYSPLRSIRKINQPKKYIILAHPLLEGSGINSLGGFLERNLKKYFHLSPPPYHISTLSL